MSNLKKLIVAIVAGLAVFLAACGATGGGFNLFPPEQDIALGQEVARQIESNPKEYPVLPEKGNEAIYQYVRGITQRILNTGKVRFRNEFAWEVRIINDDKTLNAFATPGGYIYVYTGLIKFLDSEDQLAGVLGHEIAHAAERHSTEQMSKIYGVSALVSIATGSSNPGALEQIALGLLSLTFSRAHETEADAYSVVYLCGTDYNATGAAGFFEKMEGQPTPPAFLSTHPNPGNRVANIKAKAKELGCRGNSTNRDKYAQMKRMLK